MKHVKKEAIIAGSIFIVLFLIGVMGATNSGSDRLSVDLSWLPYGVDHTGAPMAPVLITKPGPNGFVVAAYYDRSGNKYYCYYKREGSTVVWKNIPEPGIDYPGLDSPH